MTNHEALEIIWKAWNSILENTENNLTSRDKKAMRFAFHRNSLEITRHAWSSVLNNPKNSLSDVEIIQDIEDALMAPYSGPDSFNNMANEFHILTEMFHFVQNRQQQAQNGN